MLKNQVHPAAIRSRNLISDSLLSLMDRHSYDKITVKEITDEAQLTRRTFYAHFKTKEDVIYYKIDRLNAELTECIYKNDFKNHHEIALIYFSFWVNHVSLLKVLYDHKLMQLLFDNFDNNIRDIRSYFGCANMTDDIYSNYSSAFFTGVLSSILTKWIATGSKETAEDLVDILEKITYKFSNSFRS